MQTIDFLPDIYRQRTALRRARVWWCAIVLLFGGTIGSAIAAQVWLRVGLKRQLAAVEGDFAASQTQVKELANLQAQIAKSAQEASLFTYLQHPWPRTQLLAQVVEPLPKSIRLTQIHIRDEELPREPPQAGQFPRGSEPETKVQPPEADLAKLQQELDFKQTVIELQGHTPDVSRLHEYVARLNSSPLIAATHVKSLEADTDPAQLRTRFTLRLFVQPGYGQRGNEAPLPLPLGEGKGAGLVARRGPFSLQTTQSPLPIAAEPQPGYGSRKSEVESQRSAHRTSDLRLPNSQTGGGG